MRTLVAGWSWVPSCCGFDRLPTGMRDGSAYMQCCCLQLCVASLLPQVRTVAATLSGDLQFPYCYQVWIPFIRRLEGDADHSHNFVVPCKKLFCLQKEPRDTFDTVHIVSCRLPIQHVTRLWQGSPKQPVQHGRCISGRKRVSLLQWLLLAETLQMRHVRPVRHIGGTHKHTYHCDTPVVPVNVHDQ